MKALSVIVPHYLLYDPFPSNQLFVILMDVILFCYCHLLSYCLELISSVLMKVRLLIFQDETATLWGLMNVLL